MASVVSLLLPVTAWVAAMSSTAPTRVSENSGPHWSSLFWVGCVLWLLLRVWRGWQAGLPRQVCAVVALLAGALAGWLLAPGAASLLRTYWTYPDPVLLTGGGILAGFVVWFGITLLSRVLFKTTGQQTFAPVRLLYGAGGALIGVVLGLVGVVVFASGARLLGTVAAAARAPAQTTAGASPNPRAQRTVEGLHNLKQSLENGPGGGLLELFDPVPASTYRQLADTARVAADPRAQERLLEDPRIRRLADNPRIVALRDDRDIVRALEEKDFLRLLRDPRVLALARDAQVQAEIRAIDWPAALARALRAMPSADGTPARTDPR